MSLSAASVLRRYYAVSLVYALAGGFLAGVYPIFLRSRGLNQLEINSVLAVYFMVTFLTDVPTGAAGGTQGGLELRSAADLLTSGWPSYGPGRKQSSCSKGRLA